MIEVLLENYSNEDDTVYDPFCGSGTVLFESGRKGLSAYGTEINPAAVKLSKIYELINISNDERVELIKFFDKSIHKMNSQKYPLFKDESTDNNGFFKSLEKIGSFIHEEDEYKKILYEFLIVGSNLHHENLSKIWPKTRKLIKNLPFSGQVIRAYHADARKSPLYSNTVDLVITSPPYINVFNYHQQYRESVEYLKYDILKIAKSEIGSNRKNRSNRFLTAVQYCLDIAKTFNELRRISKDNSRIIFIVGRESMVRGTRMYNSRILTEIATEVMGFEFILKQKREFVNQFGTNIVEDILHFSTNKKISSRKITKDDVLNVAVHFLEDSLQEAPPKALNDIKEAINNAHNVKSSPIFKAN